MIEEIAVDLMSIQIVAQNVNALMKNEEEGVSKKHHPELQQLRELQVAEGWIADGICHDIKINLDRTYDRGDCCGSNVNKDLGTECQWKETYIASCSEGQFLKILF